MKIRSTTVVVAIGIIGIVCMISPLPLFGRLMRLNLSWLKFTALQVEETDNPLYRYTRSIAVLNQILTITPGSLNAHRLLGIALLQAGDARKAIEQFQLVPGMSAELVTRGSVQWAEGHFNEAGPWYAVALELSESGQPEIRFRCMTSFILSRETIPPSCFSEELLQPHLLRPNIYIPGSALRWMESFPAWGIASGDVLGEVAYLQSGAGGMWWPGSAIVVVETETAGEYHLKLWSQALQSDMKISLLVDGMSMAEVELVEGMVRDSDIAFPLLPGLHVIGISLSGNSGQLIVHGIEMNLVQEQ